MQYHAIMLGGENPSTIYEELGEPACDPEVHGRTDITRAKETLDNDVESLLLELLTVHGES